MLFRCEVRYYWHDFKIFIIKKTLTLYILNIFYFLNLFSQSTTSAVALETIYAQNGLFYLHTIPYDNQEPSLRGKTCVYRINDPVPLYEFYIIGACGAGRDCKSIL